MEATPLIKVVKIGGNVVDNEPMLQAFCRVFGGDSWGGVTVNALDGTIIDKDKGY